MPALNFKVFIDKILYGEKCQTIIPKRKYPIKKGDKLFLYTGMRTNNCKKLGEAVCNEIIPIKFEKTKFWLLAELKTPIDHYIFSWDEITSLVRADGFKGYYDFVDFFIKTYNFKTGDFKEFDIIKWHEFKKGELL